MAKYSTKYGYFTDDGSEYVITTPKTPKPWINVISNGDYGFTISQSGSGFSWKTHSEFNRITRWHQDLIKDDWGKYIFIRNNENGEVWNPAWMPTKTELDFYECRHGLGYTTIKSEFKGIQVVLTLFVPLNANLEIWNVQIKNFTNKKINLSLITYFEWVLGSSNDYHREFHKQFLGTEYSENMNLLLATKRLWDIPLGDRGHWNIDYQYTGFISCDKEIESYESDKEAFIGQYNSLSNAKALKQKSLSNTAGSYYDSIGSLKVDIQIEPNQNENLNFYLGLTKTKDEIKSVLSKFNSNEKVFNELNNIKEFWKELLEPLEIDTPDDAMNIGVNLWFRYQAISGRIWGRTAFYQQSGAIGFRDQLQDSLVFLPIKHELTKKQILLHAKHQMKDGSVLHWWHPITDTGLKTEMTDDLLWLPFAIIQYVNETGDLSILDEKVQFYDDKNFAATLFDHCKVTIEKVLSRKSDRGLLLIGEGDWNDGLSAVGLDMKGESVWLTEFLYYVINNFLPILKKIGKNELLNYYKNELTKIKGAFLKYAWDGEWYWRASKDSGRKLGSKESGEGKIYLNSQTWSVISEIVPEEYTRKAMESVKKNLLKNNGPLLLYPAYSQPDKYIGYLSRYAAGRRENGGVYSHAATWSIWAFGKLNDEENAFEVYKRLNPILSGIDPDKYVAEPYVMPGNIDGPDSPNYGMAGWTWYTGSASWFQKVIVDWILGIRATYEGLVVDPKIPKEWNNVKVKRTFRGTQYLIEIENFNHVCCGVQQLEVDGNEISGNLIKPKSDKSLVNVRVVLGQLSTVE